MIIDVGEKYPGRPRRLETTQTFRPFHNNCGVWIIEDFIETQNNLNQARATMDLPEIPVRWHNIYFQEADFRRAAAPFFESVVFQDFCSSYYFATRVIYSAMCKMRGEKPDYNHEIHRLAGRLPWVGQFSPLRLAVLRRRL